MEILRSIILILMLLFLTLNLSSAEKMKKAKDELYFGAITTVRPEIVERNFKPFLEYLSKKLGKRVVFKTGLNYEDTIEKFINGTFDLGYIGPSPYVLATRKDRDALKLIAGVETNNEPYFYAIIVARRDSNISKLKDLEGKRFAFGSRRSTLAFYLPFYMLEKRGLIDKLKYYDILGRHDIVAKNVIMGNYDAGGIKESVAKRYDRYLKRVAVSQPMVDFAIVAHKSLDENLSNHLKKALFELQDKNILTAIKRRVTGFGERKDSDYDDLRKIMNIVDRKVK